MHTEAEYREVCRDENKSVGLRAKAEVILICVTHQGLAGTLENVAHILTGTRLWLVPTDESKMVGLLDTLCQSQDKQEAGINGSEWETILLHLCIQSSNTNNKTSTKNGTCHWHHNGSWHSPFPFSVQLVKRPLGSRKTVYYLYAACPFKEMGLHWAVRQRTYFYITDKDVICHQIKDWK